MCTGPSREEEYVKRLQFVSKNDETVKGISAIANRLWGFCGIKLYAFWAQVS